MNKIFLDRQSVLMVQQAGYIGAFALEAYLSPHPHLPVKLHGMVQFPSQKQHTHDRIHNVLYKRQRTSILVMPK